MFDTGRPLGTSFDLTDIEKQAVQFILECKVTLGVKDFQRGGVNFWPRSSSKNRNRSSATSAVLRASPRDTNKPLKLR